MFSLSNFLSLFDLGHERFWRNSTFIDTCSAYGWGRLQMLMIS